MIRWKSLSEFDYGTGDILLLMKADPKKTVWRGPQDYVPEGYKGYKVRDEVVTYSTFDKSDGRHSRAWMVPEEELQASLGRPVKRDGDKIQVWGMSRTAWDNVVAWMWKKDLIEDYLNSQSK